LNRFILTITILFSFQCYSQDLWKMTSSSPIEELSKSSIVQKREVSTAYLNPVLFQQKFTLSHQKKTDLVLSFPNEYGESEEFLLFPIKILSSKVSAKYPNISTYYGKSKLRKNVTLRITKTSLGISGTMRTPAGMLYLQPKKTNRNEYQYYLRDNLKDDDAAVFNCGTPSPIKNPKTVSDRNKSNNQKVNTNFKTYRFAVATSAEYTSFWGDDDATNGSNRQDAFAAVVNTVNRMNEVMEVDLGVRLVIVSDETLMFEDSETDPFGDDLNSEIQSVLTERIGEANYDVGHLFHRSAANGNAGSVGNVCRNGRKGSAFSAHPFTATNGSEGEFLTDYFDVDYVLHEVGHQFGAIHTFAHETESYGVNSEPGSGSTIMSYAGIVSGQNMQRHSDPYFHHHSIKNMQDYLARYSCQEVISENNLPPTVNAGENKSIPKGTPYLLEAQAVDPDNDNLTYCWEQLDSGEVGAQNLGPYLLMGSMNRSLPPSSSNFRSIPRMSSVLAGELSDTSKSIGSTWETVSLVGRTLNWGVTVRDRNEAHPNGFGSTDFDDIILNVIENAGPFRVTSQQNSPTVWETGQNVIITWDVARTNLAPIATTSVTLLLSLDGGENFNYTLLSNTPNDGQETIVVPEGITSSQARLMIKAVNNIYFAVNEVNFSIEQRNFAFPLVNHVKTICDGLSLEYAFTFRAYETLSSPVNAQVVDLPRGFSSVLSPTTFQSDGETGTILITAESQVVTSLSLVLQGQNNELLETQNFQANFLSSAVEPPLLSYPEDNSSDLSNNVNLNWNSMISATNYRVEVSDTEGFTNVLINSLTETNTLRIEDLTSLTTYYWRVFARTVCGESDASEIRQFTTQNINCAAFSGNDLPRLIFDAGAEGPRTTVIDIPVADDLTIIDLDVNISLTHTYVEDLTLQLTTPAGNTITLSESLGGNGDDYTQTIFDSEATQSILSAGPPFTGTYRPIEALDEVYGLSSQGIWQLRIIDNYPQDSGRIQVADLFFCLNGVPEINSDGDLWIDSEDNCPLVNNQDQLDSDNDGEGDLCDIDAQRNFTLSKSDETCIERNNGKIMISATALFSYTAQILGPNGYNEQVDFSLDTVALNNLESGDYLICITTEDIPNFEQCFTSSIDQPLPLNVSSKLEASKRQLTLDLSGSKVYKIQHNGNNFEINNKSSHTIPLVKGLNVVKVTTPLACQGVVEEYVYLDAPSVIYPNPVHDNLTVLVGGKGESVDLAIFDLQGNQLITQSTQLSELNRKVVLDIQPLSVANYVLKVRSEGKEETLKFIKQ